MSTWKRDFASGLIVLGPILATLYVVYVLYGILAGYTPGILLNAETLEPLLSGIGEQARERIAGLFRVVIFLIILSGLILAVGYSMRTTIGTAFERFVDSIINQIPGLRLVYNASKTAAETALGDFESLQTPVKVETWAGLRMTGFKTGITTPDGREYLFIPTSPNITSGFLVEVESEDIVEIDETVEEALTRIISAGFGDSDRSSKAMADGISIPVSDEKAPRKHED